MRLFWKISRFCFSVLARTCVLLALLPFTREKSITRAIHQRRACVALAKIINLRMSVVGDAPNDAPTILVSNHISLVDPIALAALANVAFTGKAEILTWPVVRWVCRSVGLIPVSRDRAMRTRDLIEQMRNRLADSVNVVLFPEGTTSSGESILPFKTAAFASVENNSSFTITPVCLVAHGDRASITWSDDAPISTVALNLLRLKEINFSVKFGTPIIADGSRKEIADNCFRIITDMHNSLVSQSMNFER